MHKLEKIRRFVIIVILIEYLIIFILLINKINKLNDDYKKLENRIKKKKYKVNYTMKTY